MANQEQPPTTTQQQPLPTKNNRPQPLPKIQISQKPPHKSPHKKKKKITFLYFPSVSHQPNKKKRAKKTKNDIPKREENTFGWNSSDPHDSRPSNEHGTLLIFPTMKSYFGGHKPINKKTPKRMSLTAAIGKQTTNFNHSYNPLIRPVLLKKESTVDDPYTCRPLDPRNSYGFSLLLTIILLSFLLHCRCPYRCYGESFDECDL